MSSNSLFAVVPPSSKKPLTITVSSNGAVTTAKPRTRLLKIPILTLSLIEPLINIIADYASDDRDLMIVIQMIIFDFEYVAPAQYDRRVIELFDLCHEIGHMEWMSLHKESGLDRWWISRDWHGPSQENLAYSYTDLSNIDWFKSVWATLKRGVWFPKLWRDIKLEWSRHNDSRFQHCSSCLHAVSPSEPSTIYDLVGNSHRWVRGSTLKGHSLLPSQKHTHYECLNCKAHFIHFYDLVPDILKAIQQFGVPDRCVSVLP